MHFLIIGLIGVGLIWFSINYFKSRAKLVSKQKELEEVELQEKEFDLDSNIVNKKIKLQNRNEKLDERKGKLNEN